jgi:hypothetical protein
MIRLRHILLFLIVMTFVFPSGAQTLEWDWVQHGGGNSKGAGSANYTDLDGNVYVVGYFYESITFGSITLTAQNSDYYSLFVVKYDPQHEVLWAYGGQNGQAMAVSGAGDGSVYITGWHGGTTTFGNSTFTSNSGSNAFILKLNSNGNQIWVKNIHTLPGLYEGNQHGRAILNAPNGDIYVAGDFSGNTLMIDGSSVENPNVGCFGDIWFARFTPSGTLNWIKRMGGYGADEVAGLAMDGNGDVYMTGNSYCSTIAVFDTIEHPPSNERFFTAKFAPSGSIYWARFAGNSYADGVRAIYTDADGNSYITGTAWLSNSQDFGNGVSISSHGYKDQFLVKYDNAGTTVWAKSIGGSQQDEGQGLCVDQWGNICVAGFTQSPELILENDTLPFNGTPMYITRFNSNGDLISLHTVEAPTFCAHINPSDITSDTYGNLYVVGSYASDTVLFDSIELHKNSGCNGDYFIARLGNPNSVLSVETTNSALLPLYPNPVSDKLHVLLPDCADMEVLSIDGESIVQILGINNEQIIDVSNLPNGVYLLRVRSEKGVWVNEFMKE